MIIIFISNLPCSGSTDCVCTNCMTVYVCHSAFLLLICTYNISHGRRQNMPYTDSSALFYKVSERFQHYWKQNDCSINLYSILTGKWWEGQLPRNGHSTLEVKIIIQNTENLQSESRDQDKSLNYNNVTHACTVIEESDPLQHIIKILASQTEDNRKVLSVKFHSGVHRGARPVTQACSTFSIDIYI